MNNINQHIEFLKRAIDNDLAGEVVIKKGIFLYVKYSKSIGDFITDFYESDLVDYNYIDNIESIKDVYSCDKNTSLQDLRTILTSIIRKDRYSEGFLLKHIKNGNLYKLLNNIREGLVVWN